MIPKETDILGVYVPPILVVAVLSLILTWLVALMLNKLRLWRFFANPQIAFLSIVVLLFAAIDAFILPV